MDKPDHEPDSGPPSRSSLRVLAGVDPSPEDLERGAAIPPCECPRRYCWWWISLSFEWHLTSTEGCTFLKAKKHPDWRYADIPCCRSASSSFLDHFEPREPQIEADGIDGSGWLKCRDEKNEGL